MSNCHRPVASSIHIFEFLAVCKTLPDTLERMFWPKQTKLLGDLSLVGDDKGVIRSTSTLEEVA